MLRNKTPFVAFVLFTLFSLVLITKSTSVAATEPPEYMIGPHDSLNIFVWKEPELTRDIYVMSDGRISFPLIGTILAKGKTVAQLRDIITAELKNFIDSPEVTVILNESSNMVYTIGNVRTPGPYPLIANMTVLHLLSAAGGFSEWADQKKILIIRRQQGKEVQLHFNYKEFIDGDNVEQNIMLRPKDTIVVP